MNEPQCQRYGTIVAPKIAMRRASEHLPDEKAPTSGNYELLNIFGTPTGVTVYVKEGARLNISRTAARTRQNLAAQLIVELAQRRGGVS